LSGDGPNIRHGEDLSEEVVEPNGAIRIGKKPIRVQPDSKRGTVAIVGREEVGLVVAFQVLECVEWIIHHGVVERARVVGIGRIVLIDGIHWDRPEARPLALETAQPSVAGASIALVHRVRPQSAA